MLVKLDNPQLLSKAVEIISELVTEVRIKINEFGLSINAIDPANVAMVGFKIPRSVFSQYEVDNEVLGVNLDNLKSILKRAGVGSSIILESKDNVLNIQIIDRIRRNFSLMLIDVDSEDKAMPSLEYAAKVELKSPDFQASIEDCIIVSDACSFIIKNANFIIESRGINSAKSEFTSDDALIDGEDCRARYSLEYLVKFLKGVKLSDKVRLNFATEHPLKMDIKSDHMELSFILAPRVENEE